MTSTFTPSNRLTLQGDGDNPSTWGDIANGVFGLIDQALDGVIAVSVSAANFSLTALDGTSDQARNRLIQMTGAPTVNRTVTIPDDSKVYFIDGLCTTLTSVTWKNVSGTGVTIPSNKKSIIYCDGASTRSFYQQTTTPLLAANNLSDVASVPAALTNLGITSVGTTTLVALLEMIYPIGTVYGNATDNTNPGTLFGFGTWAPYAAGLVMAGVGTGTDENAVSQTITGGEQVGEYQHTLVLAEIPPAQVTIAYDPFTFGGGGGAREGIASGSGSPNNTYTTTGGGGPHNNVQPTIGTYLWTRTA